MMIMMVMVKSHHHLHHHFYDHDEDHDQYSDADQSRAIRQSTGGEYAVIVGIVRRCLHHDYDHDCDDYLSHDYYHDDNNDDLFMCRHLLDKEELLVVPHLNIGMDR